MFNRKSQIMKQIAGSMGVPMVDVSMSKVTVADMIGAPDEVVDHMRCDGTYTYALPKRVDLAALAREYGVGNLRFFIPMRPTMDLGMFGLPFGVTSSDDPEIEVECVVDEGRYKVEDNYKITLRATVEGFSYETFYQMDFESLNERYPDSYRIYVLVDEDNKYQRLA